jgi:hypothetical protein
MSNAGWIDVWNLALKVTANEPTPLTILIGLGAVFVVVMFLEGLRASFLPVRYASLIARKYPNTLAQPPSLQARASSPSQVYETRPFRASQPKRVAPGGQNQKRSIAQVRPTRPTKPQIRRMPMVNMEQAFQAQELPSFSPTSPAEPQTEV